MVPKLLRKADIVLAAIVILAAAAIMAGQSLGRSAHGGREAVIEVDNQQIRRIPFSQVTGVATIDVPARNGRKATVEVASDGRVRISESDCPDKICVRTGWITRPGQVIVCLPNRIVVEIEGDPQDGRHSLDGVAY
ncbi:MAG: NusG domain II-containing protein [Bacillota bacterium]